MQLKNPIEYMQYDKISDDIMMLDKNNIIRFNVMLAKTNDSGRKFFHTEYKYKSNNSDYKSLITLRRSYDYFLSFENIYRNEIGYKEYVIVGISDYMQLKFGLEEAFRWFRDEKYSKLFMTKNGKLIMSTPIPDFVISNLPKNKYIRLMPCILVKGETEREPGIEMEIGSASNIIRMTIKHFMGMYYILSNFNMLECSQNMINYLGHPEFGTNMIDYTGNFIVQNTNDIDSEPETEYFRKRRIASERNKRITDME